ncbi:hypothetical protein AAMO2058_000055900 [Amorphochlora amoebiformis]
MGIVNECREQDTRSRQIFVDKGRPDNACARVLLVEGNKNGRRETLMSASDDQLLWAAITVRNRDIDGTSSYQSNDIGEVYVRGEGEKKRQGMRAG